MSRERPSGASRPDAGRARRSGGRAAAAPPTPPARARYPSATRAVEYQQLLARLVEARLTLGLSQEEVGRRLGRPHQFVSKSETGERRLDPIDLWRFAVAYGRPVTDFLPPWPDAGDAGDEREGG